MADPIRLTTQVASRSGIVTSAGTLLANNPYRIGVIIQNLSGTDPLYVKFGGSASTTDFDVILKAGLTDDDGLGGHLQYDVLSYTGIITVAGASVRCTATEF